MSHWKLKDDKEITAYVRVASEDTPIAIVHDGESRAVRQMLRYAQLGEEVELVMDQLAAGMISESVAGSRCLVLVKKAIADTSLRGKIPCPEVEL